MRPLFIADVQPDRPCSGCGAVMPLIRVSASFQDDAPHRRALLALTCRCGTALMLMAERVSDPEDER